MAEIVWTDEAEQWLLKIHDALVAAEQLIQAGQVTLVERLASLPALEVTVATSRKPYRTPLRFANPYAYRGARLLADYDALARGVLTAAHVGLVESDDAERLLGQCAGKIRGVFCVPQGYRFLGVDRSVLAQGTAVAEQAHKAMGEVPRHAFVPRHLQEQAYIDIAAAGFWDWPGPSEQILFDKARIIPVIGDGPHADFLVQVRKILPPEISLFGERPNQLAKCLTVRQRLMSRPTSAITVCAVKASMPSISVRSTPTFW